MARLPTIALIPRDYMSRAKEPLTISFHGHANRMWNAPTPPHPPASCVISHPLLWTCVPSLIRDVGEAERWKERMKRQCAGLAAALRVWWDHLFSPSHTNTSIKGKQQQCCIMRKKDKNSNGNTKTSAETRFVNAARGSTCTREWPYSH